MGWAKRPYDYADCLRVSPSQLIARKEEHLKNLTVAQQTAYEKIKILYPDAELEWIFYPYIVDIYIPSIHVAIEIDGASHKNKKDYDKRRDKVLRSKYRLKVYRFKNREVFTERFDMKIVGLLKIAQIKKSK